MPEDRGVRKCAKACARAWAESGEMAGSGGQRQAEQRNSGAVA